jgi:DNA-binding LytR/AlgR family response regulator
LRVSIKNTDGDHIINLIDIKYAEADSNYTTIVTTKKKILVSKSLKTFEDVLGLIRCHRSFLVNPNYIDRMKDGYAFIDEKAIPISQNKELIINNIIVI